MESFVADLDACTGSEKEETLDAYRMRERIKEDEAMRVLREEASYIRHVLASAQVEDHSLASSWSLCHEKRGIRVFYRKETWTKNHSIHISGCIDTSVEDLVAVLYESSLWHEVVGSSLFFPHFFSFVVIHDELLIR